MGPNNTKTLPLLPPPPTAIPAAAPTFATIPAAAPASAAVPATAVGSLNGRPICELGPGELTHSDTNELVNVKVAMRKLSLAATTQVRIPGLLQRKKKRNQKSSIPDF